MAERGDFRWAGRNGPKAAIRNRVWSGLVETRVNVGPVFDRIPNFVGAYIAAKRLSELDEWRRARVIKCNPDPAQIPVRLHALRRQAPVLACSRSPQELPLPAHRSRQAGREGLDFEIAATAQGFTQHGEPLGFEDMPKLDFCVVGCVAGHAIGRAHG